MPSDDQQKVTCPRCGYRRPASEFQAGMECPRCAFDVDDALADIRAIGGAE